LTPLDSPSIALSSQQGVSCTLFLNRITLRICCFALNQQPNRLVVGL
jgi:hypothetical protein